MDTERRWKGARGHDRAQNEHLTGWRDGEKSPSSVCDNVVLAEEAMTYTEDSLLGCATSYQFTVA